MSNLTDEQESFVQTLLSLREGKGLCLCNSCSEHDSTGFAKPLLERRNLIWRSTSDRHFHSTANVRSSTVVRVVAQLSVLKFVSSAALVSLFSLFSFGVVDSNGDTVNGDGGVQRQRQPLPVVRDPEHHVLHNLPLGQGLPVCLPVVGGDCSGDDDVSQYPSQSDDLINEEPEGPEGAADASVVQDAHGAVPPPSPVHLATGYIGYWAAQSKFRADSGEYFFAICCLNKLTVFLSFRNHP